MSDTMANPLGNSPAGTPKGVTRLVNNLNSSTAGRALKSIDVQKEMLANLKEIRSLLTSLGGDVEDDFSFNKRSFNQSQQEKKRKGRKEVERRNQRGSQKKRDKEVSSLFDKIKEVFSKFGDSVKEFGSTLKSGTSNVLHGLGEGAFRTLLGPLGLLLHPVEEQGGFNLYDALFRRGGGKGKFGVKGGKGFGEENTEEKKGGFFGKFTKIFSSGGIFSKWRKGKPRRLTVLPRDPGSVLIYDALTQKEKQEKQAKKGGLLSNLFGGAFGGAAFGGLMKSAPKLLKLLGVGLPILAIAGTLALDAFGKGGALQFFKQGKTGKGILTLLLGKDLSKRSTMGKLLGIGEQGLKWGAVGFLIGGPIGALIGFGVGAAGAGIKLGFDSGWFKNKMVPWLNQAAKNAGSFIQGKIFDPIKNLLHSIGNWLGDFLAKIPATIASTAVNIEKWAMTNVIDPSFGAIKGVFDKIIAGVVKGFDTVGSFVTGLIDKVKFSISNFFGKIGDFFSYIGHRGVFGMIKDIATNNFNKNFATYEQGQQFGRTALSDKSIQAKLADTREFIAARREAGGPANAKSYEIAMQKTVAEIVKAIQEGKKERPYIQNIIQDAYNIDSLPASQFPKTN